LPENSKTPSDNSNSPILILIIIILSCAILIIFGYCFFKRFKKNSQPNEIENNFSIPESYTSQPIFSLLEKYN